MRKLKPKTQTQYLRAVKRLAKYLGRSPDQANAEDLRRFQLHLVEHGASSTTLNATITGLRFFFEVTLGAPERLANMSPVREPRKAPGGVEPGGGDATARGGTEPEGAGGAIGGLRRGAAGL
jgi:integrase/recombinase XerD